MTLRTHRWANHAAGMGTLAALLLAASSTARGQVFVVGEKTSTADIKTDFTPTNVELPDSRLTERGRRELIRNMEDEQGFAHRALPMGPGLTLRANGPISPGPDQYRKMIFDKGQAAAAGDRVAITAMVIKNDRIIFDLNGGPYAKHRFLSHIQVNDMNVANPEARATGARVTLVFEDGLPEISAPELKALLEPVIDFGVKTSDQAYADTLPAPLKDAIVSHDVLVGMTHRMVLAALGAPESKLHEQPSGDPNGARYEEWIYGHVPQTVRFIRFVGDKVVVVEIAELGKPMEIHDKDEMAGYIAPVLEHEIALKDRKPDSPDGGDKAAAPPPTLAKPGESIALPNASGKVQFPADPKSADSDAASTQPGDSSTGSATGPLTNPAPNSGSGTSKHSTASPAVPNASSPLL